MLEILQWHCSFSRLMIPIVWMTTTKLVSFAIGTQLVVVLNLIFPPFQTEQLFLHCCCVFFVRYRFIWSLPLIFFMLSLLSFLLIDKPWAHQKVFEKPYSDWSKDLLVSSQICCCCYWKDSQKLSRERERKMTKYSTRSIVMILAKLTTNKIQKKKKNMRHAYMIKIQQK